MNDRFGVRPDFPFAPRRIRGRDGDIVYFDAGAGPAIVCIHGLVGDFTHFEFLAPRLVAAGFRVIGMDLPGCGASHKKRRRYDTDGYARDVMDLVDALGLLQVTLLGHSAGGAIAGETALRLPSRVVGLVLLSSAGLCDFGGKAQLAARSILRPWLLERSLEALAMPLLDLVLVEQNGYTQRFIRSALDRPKQPTLKEMARVMSDFVPELMRPSLLTRVDLFELPVLVVWGATDRLIPEASARILAGGLKQGTLLKLSGCGHMPMVERPEAVARAIARFAQANGLGEDVRSARTRAA